MSTGERRTLVTSFESLRAGDLVEGLCDCGDVHRMLLTKMCGESCHRLRVGADTGWHGMPGPKCCPARFVNEYAVQLGRVYIIDTGATTEDTTPARTRRPRETAGSR